MQPPSVPNSKLYWDRLLESAPRVLSCLDREPFSRSAGSFDRPHWAWGASDVSNMDLQRFILPLSFLYQSQVPGNPYSHRKDLLQWIEQAFSFSFTEQYANGAFTQWYPNDNSVITAGLLLHDMGLALQLLGEGLGAKTRERFLRMARQAGRFLLRQEEQHGFNSNHRLGIAAGLLDLHVLTGETVYRERAKTFLNRVLRHQMPSGGFLEYEGADPGYQTLGIAHLAACLERLTDPRIREGLAKALEFSSHFLSPVSGNGGCYGSRGTKLLFPSGFELAARLRVGPDLRAAVRPLIQRDLGVTNRTTDLHNLAPLLADYVRAALAAGKEAGESPASARHTHPTDFFCPQSTLFCFQRGRVTARGRWNGGMVQVEDEESGQTLFSSAGYVVWLAGGTGFTGVMNGEAERQDNQMIFRARAQRPARLRQRPAFFLLLRVLQLLFGRFMAANLCLKWLLARLLLFRRQTLPFRISRTIRWTPSALVIEENLENLSAKPARVQHCREGYLNFMGSARYFDSSQLTSTVDREAAWELPPGGRRRIRHEIAIPSETLTTLKRDGLMSGCSRNEQSPGDTP